MGGARGKERKWRREEDQNMLHVYVQRQQNEMHQTLFEKEGKRKGGIGI
jgi:hypothetical protein